MSQGSLGVHLVAYQANLVRETHYFRPARTWSLSAESARACTQTQI